MFLSPVLRIINPNIRYFSIETAHSSIRARSVNIRWEEDAVVHSFHVLNHSCSFTQSQSVSVYIEASQDEPEGKPPSMHRGWWTRCSCIVTGVIVFWTRSSTIFPLFPHVNVVLLLAVEAEHRFYTLRSVYKSQGVLLRRWKQFSNVIKVWEVNPDDITRVLVFHIIS